ncbi:MAG: DsrE family protein [Pseudomonadota bacterium]
MKNLLVQINKPPYKGSQVLEAIDAAMVGAVFDCQVTVLFRGQGVLALWPDQDATGIEQKTVSKVLSALPTYEVKRICACAEDLLAFNLPVRNLAVPIEVVGYAEIAELMQNQDAVIGI